MGFLLTKITANSALSGLTHCSLHVRSGPNQIVTRGRATFVSSAIPVEQRSAYEDSATKGDIGEATRENI